MSKGAKIAAKVKVAIGKASAATGDQALVGTIHRRGAASGPVYEPVYAASTDHSCNVLFSKFDSLEKSGTSIAADDVKLIVSILDIEPTTADTITVAGNTYEIMNVTPTQPGGTPLMWTLQARR